MSALLNKTTAWSLGLILSLTGAAWAGPSFSLSAGLRGDFDLADGSRIGLRTWTAESSWTHVKDAGATVIEHGLGGTLFVFDGLDLEDRVGLAAYSLTWIRNPSPRRTWVVSVQPTLASSFEADLGLDDFNLTAAVLRITNRSERFSWGWGLAYSMQFGEPFPIPLLQFRWNDGGCWSLDAVLPAHIVLERDLGRGWRTGLGLEVTGGQFRLDPDAHTVANPQLQMMEAVVGPHLAWASASGSELILSGGWAMHRELRLMDGADEVSDLAPETGPTCGISVRLGL